MYIKEIKLLSWIDICTSMLNAALFTIAQYGNNLNICSPTEKWINEMWYTHTHMCRHTHKYTGIQLTCVRAHTFTQEYRYTSFYCILLYYTSEMLNFYKLKAKILIQQKNCDSLYCNTCFIVMIGDLTHSISKVCLLFSFKKEGNPAIFDNMDKPEWH